MNNSRSNYPATLMSDFYKLSHREQYPEGTEYVYSTWIPRDSRKKGINKVVAFGFQGFIKEFLIDYFNEHFFTRPLEDVLSEYVRIVKHALGNSNPHTQHIEQLHTLGYLPVRIRAVKEGTLVPIKVPMMTIENTLPDFFWITNYLETLLSTQLWTPATSATLAFEYRKIMNKYAVESVGNTDFVPFQGHDFSMRGMSSFESGKTSGAGHLLSFVGTDTIPAILYAEQYYNGNIENELLGCSVKATEHSVMSSYGRDEMFTYARLLTEVYPSGMVSIVSDTWDLWSVLTQVIAPLKNEIMARDGKCVIRPDSGDPVKIVCGDPESTNPLEQKGVVEILWDIFGGTVSEQGYKILDSHVGCIYGDAISLERCDAICKGLMKKGFASINTVFGIGSFTYQYNTRDTFGFALKSTHVVVKGKEINITKDPVTDKDKVKKSLTGRVVVLQDHETGELYVKDGLSIKEEIEKRGNMLEEVFNNGYLLRDDSFSDIRNRVLSTL